MYFSTLLGSKTIKCVNRLWSSYHELCSVVDGAVLYLALGGDESNPYDGYREKERKEHMLNCADSLRDEVENLSNLYPDQNLDKVFRHLLVQIQEICRLLSEFSLKEIIYVPELTNNDALQVRIAELDIQNLVNTISDFIQNTTPLSGIQAKLVTSALVEKNPQAAIQQIFTIFEDHLRNKIGADSSLYGKDLITKSFGQNGVLTYGETQAEQEGVRSLFFGAYATFRNPHMHRIIENDTQTVLSIISLVDMLIKITDAAQDSQTEK